MMRTEYDTTWLQKLPAFSIDIKNRYNFIEPAHVQLEFLLAIFSR